MQEKFLNFSFFVIIFQIMNTFGDRLLALIKELKHNQLSFSTAMGVSRQKVSNYCKNNTFPDRAFIEKLTNQFNVNLNWLFTGEELMFRNAKKDENVSRVDLGTKTVIKTAEEKIFELNEPNIDYSTETENILKKITAEEYLEILQR